jgi:hypothetical protein
VKLRIDIVVELAGLSPRQVREAFIESLRDAVGREYAAEAIDLPHAEELFRALPREGHA